MNTAFAPASLLAQSRAPDANANTLFTATTRTEITTIFVCNTGASARTLRIFHDDDGTTYDQTTALVYDYSIAVGGYLLLTFEQGAGPTVNKSRSPGVSAGTIGWRSSAADDLTISLYGIVRQAN